jgi:serine/threonine-protein kinase
MGTAPAAGETAPVDTAIQLQVSRGNQFTIPDLRGQFWVDAEPLLRSMGWNGELNKLSNAQNSGYPSNAVATQSPAPMTTMKFSDPVTLSFAQ